MLLAPDDGKVVDFFPAKAKANEKHVVVLKYKPNEYLMVLETLVAALVNPLGNGSTDRENLDKGKLNELPHYDQHRIRHFYRKTIFDSFSGPHFTLLHPCEALLATSENRNAIATFFEERFAKYLSGICVRSICLLVQEDKGRSWEIHREFIMP